MNTLRKEDITKAVALLPKQVKQLLVEHPNEIYIAGGYIRSIITNTKVNDIDLFTQSKEKAKEFANALMNSNGFMTVGRLIETDNAFTLLDYYKYPVQFIHRWTFNNPIACINSFDFTIASAAIWNGGQKKGDLSTPEGLFVLNKDIPEWNSVCHENFYSDLCSRRLTYLSPNREEEVGGSLLRMLKFITKGFYPPHSTVANLITRLVSGIDMSKVMLNKKEIDKIQFSKVVKGLLREVDPNIAEHLILEQEIADETAK